MSFNISGEIMDLAESLHITVVISNMGPRQQASFKRMVKTGVITSTTAPGRLALIARAVHGAPYIQTGRFGSLKWNNVASDEETFFEAVTAIAVTNELISGDKGWRGKGVNEKMHDAVRLHSAEGHIYYATDNSRAKKILSTVKFLHNEPVNVPDTWTFDAKEFARFL